jgi:hypothetical protein
VKAVDDPFDRLRRDFLRSRSISTSQLLLVESVEGSSAAWDLVKLLHDSFGRLRRDFLGRLSVFHIGPFSHILLLAYRCVWGIQSTHSDNIRHMLLRKIFTFSALFDDTDSALFRRMIATHLVRMLPRNVGDLAFSRAFNSGWGEIKNSAEEKRLSSNILLAPRQWNAKVDELRGVLVQADRLLRADIIWMKEALNENLTDTDTDTDNHSFEDELGDADDQDAASETLI